MGQGVFEFEILGNSRVDKYPGNNQMFERVDEEEVENL
jgi:hypothetical protein